VPSPRSPGEPDERRSDAIAAAPMVSWFQADRPAAALGRMSEQCIERL
jgi:hypothetical protein